MLLNYFNSPASQKSNLVALHTTSQTVAQPQFADIVSGRQTGWERHQFYSLCPARDGGGDRITQATHTDLGRVKSNSIATHLDHCPSYRRCGGFSYITTSTESRWGGTSLYNTSQLAACTHINASHAIPQWLQRTRLCRQPVSHLGHYRLPHLCIPALPPTMHHATRCS